ncbi:PIR protein CIR protein [Plasmodium vinckei]|uniref:PIR protein CIR protein n=1 Tax=Plasmodium vinckei TaxID=5860 RepID=A0A6V7T8C1_PLAVN|nr:PIR protein CIR protein [Plasmodium vinckei]
MSSFSIYQSSKNILTNATNKVSNAYNNAMTIAQDTYDKTVNIAKDAYITSTNYISGVVNSIINQFNPLSTSQLSDDQSESDGSWNSLPPDNNPSSIMQIPNPDSNSPYIPQFQSPSVTLPPLQAPSQPPSSPKQLDPNDGKGGIKTLSITQVILLSSGISPSNIGNGNNPYGTDVKMNEKSSIWCIGPNNKCDVTLFITWMYNQIEEKKSVKKAINSIGGKRPVQIIIKSVDTKKMTTSIINHICGKKKSLLNIYKLMQGDPVPFINLFFLLIFFVYKRKLNYLEL